MSEHKMPFIIQEAEGQYMEYACRWNSRWMFRLLWTLS